jgi:hypothetical protein
MYLQFGINISQNMLIESSVSRVNTNWEACKRSCQKGKEKKVWNFLTSFHISAWLGSGQILNIPFLFYFTRSRTQIWLAIQYQLTLYHWNEYEKKSKQSSQVFKLMLYQTSCTSSFVLILQSKADMTEAIMQG